MNHQLKIKNIIPLIASIVSLVILIAIFLVSCYRDYGLGILDYDTILTIFNKETDFAQFSSYAMPDSIIHLVIKDQEDDLLRDYDAQILSDVARNLETKGYTRIEPPFTDTNIPDVVVLVSMSSQQWLGYTYNPSWWGWWGWYPWYPGWGWGPGWGGYYPGYVGSYKFTTGSILIEMMDANKIDPDNPQRILGIWGAGINRLVDDTKAGIRTRITNAINQAFDQSPYLQTR